MYPLRTMRRLLLLPSALLAGTALAATALAGPIEGVYAISLAGIPLGTGQISGQIDAEKYALTVSANLSGLASMVARGRGAAQASGVVQGGRVLSSGYALTASNSETTRTIQIAMGSGNVGAVKIEPPFEDRPDRVPVLDMHRRGVIDPVSALVMPMQGDNPLAPENCNRTIPIFDGTQRFDLAMTFAGVKPVKAKGFKGQVLVCKVRYKPIAGHRAEREAVKFMENNREVEVWLAQAEGARALVPFRVSIKTMVGTTVFEARQLSGAHSDLVN